MNIDYENPTTGEPNEKVMRFVKEFIEVLNKPTE